MASVTTTSAPQQQVNMPAVDLRQLLGAIIATAGIRTSSDFALSQHGGGNMSVDVGAGSCVIADGHGSGGGFYAYTLSATQNLVIAAADPSNPRIDRIVVQIHDAYQGDADNVIGPKVVAGTPTSGATLANLNGAAAVPSSSLLLGNVLVPAGATSIVTADLAFVAAILTPVGAAASGQIVMYAGATAPTGYALCDGSAVSRTTYAALFAAISTNYGTGDGSTTFNLPDYRGRMPVGYAASGGHTDVSTLGNKDTATAANARPKHRTSINESPHTHGITNPPQAIAAGASFNADGDTGSANKASVTTSINSATTGITVGTGVANDALDSPSYLVANFIIKT